MSVPASPPSFPWTGRSQRWFGLAYGGWQYVTIGLAGSGLLMLGLMAGSGGIGKKEQPVARLLLCMAILSGVLAVLGWAYARLLSRSAGRRGRFFVGVGAVWLAAVPLIGVLVCMLALRDAELPGLPSASPPQGYHVTVYRNNTVVDSYDETRTDKGPAVLGLMVLGYALLVGWSWVTLGVVPVVYGLSRGAGGMQRS